MGVLSSVRKRVSKFLDDVTPLSKAEAAARKKKRALADARVNRPRPGTLAARKARSAATYGPDTRKSNLRQAVQIYMPKKKR